MNPTPRLISPLLFAAAVLAACNGTSDTVTSQASALTTAQCTYQGFDTAAKACFDTFNTCKNAAGADLATCKSALDTCLPPPPAGSHPGHGGMEGGMCPGRGGGPNPDGGRPPEDGRGGPFGGHGGPGGGAPPPPPLAIDSAALTACRDGFTACIAADSTAMDSCRGTEHTCVREAFRAQFQARCDEGIAACAAAGADATACAAITARCAEGVDAPPPAGCP